MERSGMVTLTTDFGLSDTYVGVLKGVIWSICSDARLVDLTHQVHPQDILEGAFLLSGASRYFPRGTVHLAVVDPGVGTDRAAIAMETPQALYVAPDNGLLTMVWEEMSEAEQAATRVVILDQPHYWLLQVSSTFHGRDIFAPVAAYLAAGVPLEEVGRPHERIVLLPGTRAQLQDDGRSLLGRIVHIDHFGNCVTNVREDQVAALAVGGALQVQVAGHLLQGLSRTYAEARPGWPLVLIGSEGWLEIAVRNGSAASHLDLSVGNGVQVSTTTSRGG